MEAFIPRSSYRGYSDTHSYSSDGNGVMLTELDFSSLEDKLAAKIASVTSGYYVTCF